MSFNRPGMLERVLASLKAQTLPVAEQRVHLFQDAARNRSGGMTRATEDEIAACISVFRRHFPDGVVHEAPHNLGIALNFDRAERFFFETLNAELGIFFEDDMVLSPHYLDALEKLSAFALAEERVGYVAAYGQHHASPEEHGRLRRRIMPMGHNWGFALTRRQWKRQREIVEGYLHFVRDCEYRYRPHEEIRAYFARFGVTTTQTSQDTAKEIASAVLGTARLMCFPAYGSYIGDVGEHYTPALYKALDFGRTVLFEHAPDGFDFPTTQELTTMIEATRAQLSDPARSNGVKVTSERLPADLFVDTLYRGLLDRQPDLAGFHSFTDALEKKALQPVDVVRSIVGSAEFSRSYAQRSPSGRTAGRQPSEEKPHTMARELQQRLFGEDIYAGFAPTLRKDLQGWNSHHPALTREITARRPRIVIDVGVWKGASTIHMAKHMQALGLDGAVIAVDTFLGSPEHWNRDRPDRIFEDLGLKHGWPSLYWQFLSNVVAEGVSDLVLPVPQTSENAAVILQRLGLRAGMVHIDAAHEYEPVLRDARMYWDLLEPGGLLIGDDHPWPGVARAARDFAAEVGQPLRVEEPKWMIEKA